MTPRPKRRHKVEAPAPPTPTILWVFLWLLALPTHDGRATAQVVPPSGPIAPASQIDLPRLVDLCSQRLGLRIDYDPALVKGQVTLRIPDALSDEELWALTNQLLAQRGFTTVRASGAQTLSVIKAADAPQVARVESGRPGAGEPVIGQAEWPTQLPWSAAAESLQRAPWRCGGPGRRPGKRTPLVRSRVRRRRGVRTPPAPPAERPQP
jgi:hypothetical protein